MRSDRVLILIIFLITFSMNVVAQDKNSIVLLTTSEGNIKIKLYDETPLHRDNFLKLVSENFFEDLLFHRVIENFMIQGGDPESRTASDKALLGEGDLGYTLAAEFRLPQLFHRRGALAAARMGDEENPEKESSACQFYIATGEVYSQSKLKGLERNRFEQLKIDILKRLQAENAAKVKELYKTADRATLTEFREGLQAQAMAEAEARRSEALFSDEQKEVYMTQGGVPFLDGAYTVFGEVIEGMEVVDAIGKVAVNRHDRPLTNIKMNIELINE